uniref:DNA primase n=1 Tax=Panagrolaimus sp. PS1159 TaxID=55785 RepID=A0AC35FGY5_9BILA
MAENFNDTWLKDYYEHFYPVKSILKWLSYGKRPSEYLQNREFAFILKDDVHYRYLNFTESGQFRKELEKVIPHKVDLGAVYNHSPKDRLKYRDFKAQERELVFDIDLTDYDEIRKCCSGASVCQSCWRWMTIAVKVLDKLLRNHFGFIKILWVFSGRRGIHCWVVDETARKLDNTGRAAVADYLSLIAGTKKVEIDQNFTHPMLEDAYSTIMNCGEIDDLVVEQKWLDSSENWNSILELCKDEKMRYTLNDEFQRLTTPELRWKLLKRRFDEETRETLDERNCPEIPALAKNFLKSFVLQYAYPRLDVNVSTGTNHLLKSPFCVHPKTGKVAVPVNPKTIGSFNLETLPTMKKLIEELSKLTKAENESTKENVGKTLYYKQSSLAPYIENFESFVASAISC